MTMEAKKNLNNLGTKGAQDVQRKLKKSKKVLPPKSAITLTIDPGVLSRLNAWAKARGMSRGAAVSFAVSLLPMDNLK